MPAPYSSSQKSAISEFTGVTQGDKNTAAKVLKQHGWNVGAAVNAYFSNPQNGASNPTRTTLSKTFDKYRDDPKNEPDEINIEGTSTLLGELEIGLDDVGSLVFSELVQSPSLGRITREGFVDGLSDCNADTPAKIRNAVLQRRSQLASDKELFKNVYNHTFSLALSGGQKILPLDAAQEFWRLLFSPPGWEWRTSAHPWTDWWFEFLEGKGQKAINKDLWKQTLTFARATMVNDDISFHSEESSWPSVLDDFVEWLKKQKGFGGGSDDAMEVE